MTKEQIKEQKKQEAREYLLKNYITPKTKLLIIIKSVSASGMTRRMKVLVNNYNISYYIADLCQLSLNDNGLQIQGCGMDMTFWLSNHITNCLWGDKKPKSLKGNGGGSVRCLEWITA